MTTKERRLSANSVVLVGNPSPISGVRLKKNIRVESDGSLFFEVEAMNIRQSRVAWDLWLLTRVNGHNENYVPVSNPNDVWLGDPSHPWQGRPTYKVENGFASFTPLENPREYEECTGKLYIKTDTPVIYTKCGTEWLKIEYEHHNPSSVHPEHTEIEMYNFVHKEKRKSLLELEYHAPYKILNPNETMATWCRWSILPQMDKRF